MAQISSMSRPIPTVTQEDLLSFHTRHFNSPYKGDSESWMLNQSRTSNSDLQANTGYSDAYEENEDYEDHASYRNEPGDEEVPDEEDDGLGYYPDGSKRTLTDAQIAIFRHSEIQRLLLAKRRQDDVIAERAAERVADAVAEREAIAIAAAGGTLKVGIEIGTETVSTDAMPVERKRYQNETDAEDSGEFDDEDDEEEEAYARFLEEERRQFALDAERKRKEAREKSVALDRSVSTRRRVRELDDGVSQADVELDY